MCFMEAKLIKELPGQGKMNYFIIPYFSPLGESRKTLWCGGWKADVLQSSGSQTVMCTRIAWNLIKLQLLTGDTCVEADSAFLVSSQVTLQV